MRDGGNPATETELRDIRPAGRIGTKVDIEELASLDTGSQAWGSVAVGKPEKL